MDRFFELIQISARITMEATGVALIVESSGRSSTRTNSNARERDASSTASSMLSANPASIRPKEPKTAR